ncbi:MAG: exosortase family protein XrtG [Enterococcus sp.]
MRIILVIIILCWLYGLSVLRRAKIPAAHFIFGSIGLFVILLLLSRPYWVWFFTHLVAEGIALFSNVTHMSEVYSKYAIVQILSKTSSVTMTIDYECSGIIETSAFVALTMFYPIYTRKQRFFLSLKGILWIYLANVMRLILVILLVHFNGSDFYFVAHTIIGRMFFYVLVIYLYYQTFTYSATTYKEKKEQVH